MRRASHVTEVQWDLRTDVVIESCPERVAEQVGGGMKILCITQYYTPDVTAAAFRMSEMAELLRRKGHEVMVVTAQPHKSAVGLAADGENGVYRVDVKPLGGSGVIAYLEQYLGFSWRALRVAYRLHKKHNFDVVWASSPPLFVGVTTLALQLLCRLPVVFDVRDLWPASAVDIGKIRKGSMMERLGLLLERTIYRRSSALTCVTRPIGEHVRQRTDKRIEIVYNGVLVSGMGEVRPHPDHPRTICYAGNFGYAQGLDVVLEAFAKLVRTEGFSDCILRFVGDGAVAADLKAQAMQLGISSAVEFTGVVGKEEAVQHLASCGVQVIPLKDAQAFEAAIPSKVFDALAVGRPIVAMLKGEAAEIIRAAGGTEVVSPGDDDGLAAAFLKVIDGYEPYRKAALANPDLVRRAYSREVAVDRLEQVLMGVSGSGTGVVS